MGIIQIKNISKSYKDRKALSNINLEIKQGSLFGLLGPDGAGKSTLMRIIASLLLPEEGRVEVLGYNSITHHKKIRNMLGYMPGNFSLYSDLTVAENLNFFAKVYGVSIKKNYELISDIYKQIAPFKNRPAGKLSGGMKQKLALCCALIHKPKILILDEPTTGVDAVSRIEFWEKLKNLTRENITIIASTPYINDAELCKEIALLYEGKILCHDTPAQIKKQFSEQLYAVSSTHNYALLKDLRKMDECIAAYAFGQTIHLITKKGKNLEQFIHDYLQKKHHENIKIQKAKPNVEDLFIHLINMQKATTVYEQ